MARLNVYVPDDLASRVREAEINVSAVTRAALEEELSRRSTNTWLNELRRLPPAGVSHDDVIAALDAARDEYDPR
jgi:post-segregation antitoxin (ccd killing protein)